jgi:hypothetical protein
VRSRGFRPLPGRSPVLLRKRFHGLARAVSSALSVRAKELLERAKWAVLSCSPGLWPYLSHALTKNNTADEVRAVSSARDLLCGNRNTNA